MVNITGQITLNQLSLIEVDADPAAAAGTAAPIGSYAFFNSGTIGTSYVKVGSANTAWNISTIQASALTLGSIPFANSSGYLTQSNANLFWDSTNSRLGIGTNTPARPLSVIASTASGDNGAFVDGYGANAAVLTLRRANGTSGSPTAVTAGQVMAEFDAIGYGTSQFAPSQTGSISFIAAETFTNTANGTHIAFYTAPVGSITEAERLRIHASGRLLIGTTTDNGTDLLQLSGSAIIGVTGAQASFASWSGNTAFWINMPTTGPSGIGTGGAGANPWLAYAQGAGQWFTDAVAGDNVYRNTGGRLLFGLTSGNADMKLSSTGLEVGPVGTVLSNNPISGNGNVNSFVQLNVQNLNAGTTASSDIVATANNGTDTTNFIDMGIQSSASADAAFTIAGALGGYLYTASSALSIGTASASDIIFFTGGTLLANEKARIINSSSVLSLAGAIRLGNSTDATNGNIRFNSLGMDFYRGGSWRDLSFPKHSFEDFVFATLGSGANAYDFASTLGTGGTATVVAAAAAANHMGLITLATGTTNNNSGVAAISAFNNVNKIALGGFPITIEWRVRVPVLSTAGVNYELRLGLQDTVTAGDPTNGVHFLYNHAVNSGQWQGVTRSASTSTTVNSAVAIAINTFYRVRAEINAARTNVDFYVDSGSGYVLIGSSTTNIPLTAAPLRPVAKINKLTTATATSSTVDLDWCWWVMER